jgi:hypothetical protein
MGKYRYSSDWIHELENKYHWEYYWNQQKLIFGKIDNSDRILEIGVGSKFAYNYIKLRGFYIKSIDIDPGKEPDIVANIVEEKNIFHDFDVVMAFDVFEHIPYNEFIDVIKRCHAANINKIFIGLPRYRKLILDLSFKLPFTGEKNIYLTIPKNKITEWAHHWELGYSIFTKDKVLKDLHAIGYLCKEFYIYKNETFFYFIKEA